MKRHYDAIVIGSGCGGAAAAVLLSRLGLQTLLVEKNRYVGGKAATLEKEGFKLDHGHIIMRCQKGPHGEVLKLADCEDLIPKYSICTFWPTMYSIAGVPVKFVPSFWHQMLTPGFLRQIAAYDQTLLQYLQLFTFCSSVFAIPHKLIDTLYYTDIYSYLNKFTTSDFTHAFFGGLAVVGFGAAGHEASAGELVRVMHDGIWDVFNIGYPVNGEGVSAIPKSFLRAAARLGCDIKINTPVERIVIENGKVKGVVIDGELITASHVVSNIGIKETVHKLVGQEHFPADYLHKINSLKYSLGGISLKYALKRPITEICWGGDIPANFYQVSEDMLNHKIPHRLPSMYVVTSNIDPSLAPPGMQSLCVLTGGPGVEPGELDWTQWVETAQRQVEGDFPGIKEATLFCEVSTPDDIAHATGRFHGDAVGVAQTVDQVSDRRPSPISPIPGLYYVGADVGRNHFATELASQSAIFLYEYLKAHEVCLSHVRKPFAKVTDILELSEQKPILKGKAAVKKAKKIEIIRQHDDAAKKPRWDVVVVGTGMGGCAAGGISALHGLKTLILEKNPRPGGSCSYYEKQGFRMDTGTHLFIRGNKGPFGQLTQRLGMGHPIDFRHTQKTVHLKGVNVDVVMPKDTVGRFIKGTLILIESGISPIHYPAILRLFLEIAFMSQKNIEALDNTSVEEFMYRYTKNSEVRTMVGMLLGLFFIVGPWEASAGESIWNLQKLLWENQLSYPKGGASIIPMTFLQGAKNHGAEIRLSTGVEKIEVKNGQVAGIVTDKGEFISAHTVISTTSLADTVFKLTGAENFPEAYADKIKALKSSWTAVQAKIAVKKKLVEAGALVGGSPLKLNKKFTDDFARNAIGGLEKGRQGEMVPIYAPIPTNFDPDLAPKGCQIITAVAVAPTLDVPLIDPPEIWIQGMMKALHELIPGLKKNTIFCDTWTVPQLASWIGKSNGAAITTCQSPTQVRLNRPSHHTPVKGLYIAGDCGGTARGVGTELACQSGMDCGDLVAQDRVNRLV